MTGKIDAARDDLARFIIRIDKFMVMNTPDVVATAVSAKIRALEDAILEEARDVVKEDLAPWIAIRQSRREIDLVPARLKLILYEGRAGDIAALEGWIAGMREALAGRAAR